jgi:serine phosphatase RsbU (regulator of sigma subunit)/Flp pilus assembly protein TadD
LKKLKYITLLTFQWIILFYDAQKPLVDTTHFHQLTSDERLLIKEWEPKIKSAKSDSLKIELIQEMYMQMNDNDVWVLYTDLMKKHIDLYLKTKGKDDFYLEKLYGYYNDKAYYANYKNDFDNKYSFNEKALETATELGDKSKLAFHLNNDAMYFYQLGNFDIAVKKLHEALKLFTELGDLDSKNSLLNNVGFMYYEQGQHEEAMKLFKESEQICLQINDSITLALIYNNMALVHFQQKNIEEAERLFTKSLELRKNSGNLSEYAKALSNLAGIYINLGRGVEALPLIYEAIHIRESLGLNDVLSYSYYSLSNYYLKEEIKDSALYYAKESYKIANKLNFPGLLKDASKVLYKSYEMYNKIDSAYKYFKLHIEMRDSLYNEKNVGSALKEKMKYEYGQKQAADSVENAKKAEIQNIELAKQKAEKEALRNQQYLLFGGLGILLLFGAFMYNRFKVTQRQKEVIEFQKTEVEKQREISENLRHESDHQRHLVEEKNKEITDSINYAKRIQEAILPSRYSLVENLKNGFIFFKPKDVVSGDFYWLETTSPIPPPLETTPLATSIGGGTGVVYFAAADCTGHGVPGAMVSVICSNALSKALLEEGITETGKLLDRTRELVIERFAKSGEQVKDGMDISLCKLTGNTLEWSGANNPLWVVRKNTEGEYELQEFKPDKQPIGNYAEPKPFSSHSIELNQGDSIYIFTDGYADQFGGPKGKKFMYKPFKELLLSIQNLSMDEQKNRLEKQFNDWKGTNEQIDDVCIIGVRV